MPVKLELSRKENEIGNFAFYEVIKIEDKFTFYDVIKIEEKMRLGIYLRIFNPFDYGNFILFNYHKKDGFGFRFEIKAYLWERNFKIILGNAKSVIGHYLPPT